MVCKEKREAMTMTMTMTTRPGVDFNKRDVAKQSKTDITNLCSKKRKRGKEQMKEGSSQLKERR